MSQSTTRVAQGATAGLPSSAPVERFQRHCWASHQWHPRHAFTLVEILTATVLTMVMMIGVVTILGTVTTSLKESRSGLEMMDRLRSAQRTLRRDLSGATVTMLPPRDPASNEGYFEYIEGPIGPVTAGLAVNSDITHSNNGMDDDGDGFIDEPDEEPFDTLNNDGDLDTDEPDEGMDRADTTVSDTDDILMLTVRSADAPFVGLINDNPAQSTEAEIAYFVRGRTLYRRVLLIAPSVGAVSSANFYAENDLSAHRVGVNLVGNTLGDLTKPENRFAHQTANTYPGGSVGVGFPYSPFVKAVWNSGASEPVVTATDWQYLGLPTLQECSDSTWNAGSALPTITLTLPSPATWPGPRDFWLNPQPWPQVDATTGTLAAYVNGPRIGEDVLLTNVIGFDVKAWDPGAPVFQHASGVTLMPGDPGYPAELAAATPIGYGAYVDLNYNNGVSSPYLANSHFDGIGEDRSQLNPPNGPFTYDTWSFHYENDGFDEDQDDGAPGGGIDEGTNGFDDDGDGVVDDGPDYDVNGNGIIDSTPAELGELETSPPYPHPLRAIQIKIRVFEPDSRQVREVTVVQDFLPR